MFFFNKEAEHRLETIAKEIFSNPQNVQNLKSLTFIFSNSGSIISN